MAWLSWDAAHQPIKIDIDLSQLGHIRSAAAQTREALLIDEEREDDASAEAEAADSGQPEAEPVTDAIVEPVVAPIRQDLTDEPTISTEQFGVVAPLHSSSLPNRTYRLPRQYQSFHPIRREENTRCISLQISLLPTVYQ